MISINCPVCQVQLSSIQKIHINGTPFFLYRCPTCSEAVGEGKRSHQRKLAFVQDEEGKVLRLSQVTAGAAAGKPA